MDVAAGERREALRVRELDVQHPAVSLDEGEGVELALVAGVVQRAGMPPIDLEAFAGDGLDAQEGAAGSQLRAGLADMLLQV